MQKNSIVLPSWLTNKAVFQQGVSVRVKAKAAPTATVTLEITKDPTDGRRVSKLDTDYGVIFSREYTTGSKGEFEFEIPAYQASLDTYTFTFRCMSEQIMLNDIRCGDVWIFLGSDYLSVPMKDANAPKMPLKRNVMNNLRFFSPARSGLCGEVKEYPYEPAGSIEAGEWIKVRETDRMAEVSSSAFAFAYSMSDQVNYPIGVVDLAFDDSTIINWISPEAMEDIEALKDMVYEAGLYIDQEKYDELISIDNRKKEAAKLEAELEEARKHGDFDFEKEKRLAMLKGEPAPKEETEAAEEAAAELDFPSTSKEEEAKKASDDKPLSASSASKLEFDLLPEVHYKVDKKKDDSRFIAKRFRMSTLYNTKPNPLSGMAVRGFCFSPNAGELRFERYDLYLMGLLATLASVFEPRQVYNDELMPSMLFATMHPKNVDFDNPYSVLEFNENIQAFTKILTMPSGLVSLHDMLLPDRTISFTLGTRLATIALGLHFSPKMSKSSPEVSEVEIAGNKRILKFSNLSDGLKLVEGETELRGFSICGPDRIFKPAMARILYGMCVMVWRDDIEEVEGITYGFTPIPHDAVLRNVADLPVMPFRFDRDAAFFAPDLSFAECDRLEFVGKRTPDSNFEVLDIYRTFKGNGVIATDVNTKASGAASLHIRYETDKSLYGFEPVLDYASMFAPINIYGASKIVINVFNPEQRRKRLICSGFGESEIKQQLSWQKIVIPYEGEGPISLNELKIMIEDSDRVGEIYIDSIGFV